MTRGRLCPLAFAPSSGVRLIPRVFGRALTLLSVLFVLSVAGYLAGWWHGKKDVGKRPDSSPARSPVIGGDEEKF